MPQRSARPVVFIVDDEESVRKGLSLLMRSAGLPNRAFESAESLLAELEPGQEGCVLLDITMPRCDRMELQELLNRRQLGLPLIAISARDDSETSSLARQLGARLFLRKPVDDQALLDAVHWVLEGEQPSSTEGVPTR